MNIHLTEGGLLPHFNSEARPREIEATGNEIYSRMAREVAWARAALTKFNDHSRYAKIENAFDCLDCIMREVEAIHHECDCAAEHIIEQRRWDR